VILPDGDSQGVTNLATGCQMILVSSPEAQHDSPALLRTTSYKEKQGSSLTNLQLPKIILTAMEVGSWPST
jgi:hypothetical protein